MTDLGVSGRIARFFLSSQLTPLVAIVLVMAGAFAVIVTPREEEPQIDVTMANVFVAFPGASAKDVETLIAIPAEQVLSQIPGLEHVWSVSRPGQAMITVQYKVGVPRTEAIVRLHDTILSHRDWLPPELDVGDPLVRPKGIDDVPIVALTLWTRDPARGAYDLERVAHAVEVELKRVPGTREVTTIGGPGRVVQVMLDPEKLSAHGLAAADLKRALQAANTAMPAGIIVRGNETVYVETGEFLQTAKAVRELVVGVHDGQPVYLGDVARVEDGPPPPAHYAWHGIGKAGGGEPAQAGRTWPAVTIQVTKKAGENAVVVARRVEQRLAQLRNTVIPAGVETSVTRDYGRTADDKAKLLISKLLFATASVVALVLVALGRREAVIVGVAVLLTLAATLFASWAWGFTLNRVSLFALIFSIGILVDDAIVVVENIHRHRALEPDASLLALIPRAVDEVGGPTILATFTVIAALLPMAFVTGLMGPYMSPIPINASMGMVISLAVAFVITPWVALKLTPQGAHASHTQDRLDRWLASTFARLLTPFVDARRGGRRRKLLGVGILAAIGLSVSLAFVQLVVLKMLPFDNKSEFQVIVDMPAGSPVEATAAALSELGAHIATVDEVTDYQAYAGTASPINFNGLVRQYELRQMPEQGDLQVNLTDRKHRARKSHEIAAAVRPALEAIGARHKAKVKVVEVPPGPPVLSPIVAEIYGPDEAGRHALAKGVRAALGKTDGVIGIDDSIEDNAPRAWVRVDQRKAALAGVSVADIVAALRVGLAGDDVTALRDGQAKYGVPVRLTIPPEQQGRLDTLLAMTVRPEGGAGVPLSELVIVQPALREKTIYHKDLLPVTYVVADMAGNDRQPAVRDVRRTRSRRRPRGPEQRHARRALHHPARGSVPRLRAQVGRRMAGDLRDLSRHGHRVRGRPAAHLPAGGRPVRLVRDAAGHHGADPADDHRRDAGPRAAAGAVHGDVDDRDDRARGHHRPQLDPAGRLRQPPAREGRTVRAGDRRRRRGPREADRAHRPRGDAGRALHSRRSDLQRPGDRAGVRHPGVDAADAGRDPRALLRGQSPPVFVGPPARRAADSYSGAPCHSMS